MSNEIALKTERKEFNKRLVRIALPIALQSLIMSSLTLLDTLMVNKLGELPLAAVGLASQLFSVQFMVVFGFTTGCATFFTQFWGARDIKSIKKVLGVALTASLLISFLFFIVSIIWPVGVLKIFTNSSEAAELGAEYLKYAAINFVILGITMPIADALRSTQQTMTPMMISAASFFTDLVFNYLLIFGKFGFPRLGVKGAAIATVIARALELVLFIIVIFGKKNILAGPIKEYFSYSKDFAISVIKNAWVTTLNETLWSSAVAMQNAAFGRIGVTEFAAVQASRTIMDLFQTAGYCIGDATLILIGEQLGKNQIDEAKKMSGWLIRACLEVGIVTAALLIIFNKPILTLFTLTEEGYMYAGYLNIVRAVLLPANLLNALLISGMFRAGGDVRFAATTEISIMWLYSVPAAFIFALVLKLPVHWVLLLVQCESLLKIAILLKRYASGKWLKNMIQGMR